MPAYDHELFSPPAPSAQIKLRNPITNITITDVPMLIDSGADITLLPQFAIDFIGAEQDENATYELAGFDGRVSRVNAVIVDLIFLRKIFKGQYLIINQDHGLIGRDILNQLILTLNGPALNWDAK